MEGRVRQFRRPETNAHIADLALRDVTNDFGEVLVQFITRNGNQVYPVRINGRTVYVTIPED